MDDLKKSSLIFKLNQLQGRVTELNDKADGQAEVLNILSRLHLRLLIMLFNMDIQKNLVLEIFSAYLKDSWAYRLLTRSWLTDSLITARVSMMQKLEKIS